MNVVHDIETDRLIDSSKEIRQNLVQAVERLDAFVVALQGYLDRTDDCPEAAEEDDNARRPD
jgi:hypothetical protein